MSIGPAAAQTSAVLWKVIEEYTDHAISGASLLRPGIQAMIADAVSGRFQVVLAEAMDRLSRNQEDIAGLFKRMKAADMLRALISAIVLTSNIERLEVDVQGNLAEILAIASNAKSPRPDGQGLSQLKVVAGTGFEPVTFRL